MDVRERERLALSESTSADMLARLADDEDWGVRHSVAKNPNTPTAALHRLAEDDEWSVSVAAEDALSQRREDTLGW